VAARRPAPARWRLVRRPSSTAWYTSGCPPSPTQLAGDGPTRPGTVREYCLTLVRVLLSSPARLGPGRPALHGVPRTVSLFSDGILGQAGPPIAPPQPPRPAALWACPEARPGPARAALPPNPPPLSTAGLRNMSRSWRPLATPLWARGHFRQPRPGSD
jgi:hypothetical protein